MIELLRRAAAADPGRPAVVTHDAVVDYGELLARAEQVAAGLTARGVTRLGVSEHEAAPVVALLAGASAAGAEVCLYPPEGPAELQELARRFEHEVVVTDVEGLTGVEVIAPGDLATGPADPADPDSRHELPQGVRPHLVLTTGTTGLPRGVRHDWNRLVRSVRRVRPAPEERWLLAYGLHQFAGLQILLHVFAAGATLVAPAPRRPAAGLRALRELGATHASATPTYWRFLLAELRADRGAVPDLRQITLGGEAVPGPVLEELRRTFPGASISQVYAASEFGPTGSVRDVRPGLSVEVLERGDDADVAMRIVDGELWVRSRIGMLGYHGEPPVEPDGWRATGDLVEVVDDRILFLGRSSEVINVGGVKVHPVAVEEVVGAVPGVRLARVYGRKNPLTGSIVAVEVVVDHDADPAEVTSAVRTACATLPSASRPRSVKVVDQIATAGDKVKRGVDR